MPKKKVTTAEQAVLDNGSFTSISELDDISRWLRLYGHKFKYVAGKWFVRSEKGGNSWRIDIDGAEQQQAVIDMYQKMLVWAEEQAAKHPNDLIIANLPYQVLSHVTSARINNVGCLARSNPAIAARPNDFDGDSYCRVVEGQYTWTHLRVAPE